MVVEAELRARLEALHDVSGGQIRGEPTDEVTGRRTARENTELTARNERLLEEIDELRREADGLRAVREQLLQAQAARDAEDQAADRLRRADKESLERKASHLQNELDAATVAHDRLHERVLRLETEARTLRGQLDDAQHETATEKGAAKTKVAEVQGRRATQGRDGAARDGGGAARVRAPGVARRARRAAGQGAARRDGDDARARDEEGGEVKKLEASASASSRAASQEAAAAAAARARPPRGDARRVRGTEGRVARRRIEKVTALEEAERLRRRGAADSRAERRHERAPRAPPRALRRDGGAQRLEEGEAAHVAAQGGCRPSCTPRCERRGAKSKAAADVSELASKLHARGSSGARRRRCIRRGQGRAPRDLSTTRTSATAPRARNCAPSATPRGAARRSRC